MAGWCPGSQGEEQPAERATPMHLFLDLVTEKLQWFSWFSCRAAWQGPPGQGSEACRYFSAKDWGMSWQLASIKLAVNVHAFSEIFPHAWGASVTLGTVKKPKR